MKKIYLALFLFSILVCQAVVSPVYIALPSSVYGVPAEGTVSFTATLMENTDTYIDINTDNSVPDLDQLNETSLSCKYFVRSDGNCGIIKIECGNFISDLTDPSLFDTGIVNDYTSYLASPRFFFKTLTSSASIQHIALYTSS